MTISLRDIRFDSHTGRLARHIASSPRLSALLPRAEVDALLAKYGAAVQTLEAARKLRPELLDIAAMVEPAFAKGEAVDPEKLLTKLTAAQTRHDQATRVVAALVAIPEQYRFELKTLINQSADDFIEGLDAALQALLDEAEEVLEALAGMTDADSAIAEDKVELWKRWTSQHQAYREIRRDQMELLLAADGAGNFASGRPATGFAFFRGLSNAMPDFVAALADGGATRARLPFNVLDPADPEHWRMTVANRATLEPAVEYADESVAAAAAAHGAAEPAGPQPDRTRSAQFGGEHAAVQAMSRRARNATIATPKVPQPWG
jgi:hypothetical protein